MRKADADIWILTETRESIQPGEGFIGAHTPAHPTRRPDLDERWVSIWSRWPLRPTGIPPSPRGSLSVVCDTPDGEVVVYGAVLPWANEPGEGRTRAPMWSVHYEEIERQGMEWKELRDQYPSAEFALGGDFNQDRDGSSWYGTQRGRELLSQYLREAGLKCVTAEDAVATGRLASNHLVDHIALTNALSDRARFSCWEPINGDGVRMSDHPGVVVDII